MEDAHTQLLSLPGDKDAMFFGVFDGHGGKLDYYKALLFPQENDEGV